MPRVLASTPAPIDAGASSESAGAMRHDRREPSQHAEHDRHRLAERNHARDVDAGQPRIRLPHDFFSQRGRHRPRPFPQFDCGHQQVVERGVAFDQPRGRFGRDRPFAAQHPRRHDDHRQDRRRRRLIAGDAPVAWAARLIAVACHASGRGCEQERLRLHARADAIDDGGNSGFRQRAPPLQASTAAAVSRERRSQCSAPSKASTRAHSHRRSPSSTGRASAGTAPAGRDQARSCSSLIRTGSNAVRGSALSASTAAMTADAADDTGSGRSIRTSRPPRNSCCTTASSAPFQAISTRCDVARQRKPSAERRPQCRVGEPLVRRRRQDAHGIARPPASPLPVVTRVLSPSSDTCRCSMTRPPLSTAAARARRTGSVMSRAALWMRPART